MRAWSVRCTSVVETFSRPSSLLLLPLLAHDDNDYFLKETSQKPCDIDLEISMKILFQAYICRVNFI